MPSIINATTTNGVAISPDNSGSLQLATNNGTTAVTIDTSQNVGIGTSSPQQRLSVWSSEATGTAVNINNTSSGGYNWNIFSSGSAASLAPVGSLVFRDSTNGVTRMTINASGRVGVATSTPDSSYTMTIQGIGADNSSQLYIKREGSPQGLFISAGGGITTYTSYEGNNVAEGQHVWQSQKGTTVTERMRINSSGDLLVGTSSKVFLEKQNLTYSGSTNYGFAINETTAGGTAQQIVFYKNSSAVGSITSTTGGTAFNTSSDYRLKENIAPMTGALATVAKLKPCTYTWKVDGSAGQGFIAHELQAVVPECVTGEKDAVETYTDEDGNEQTRIKPQGIDTSFLVATLTAAIQELKAELDTVKAELNTLKNPPVEGTE